MNAACAGYGLFCASMEQSQFMAALLRTLVIGKSVKWTLIRIVLLVTVSVVTVKFLLLPVRVTGESMAPTYQHGGVNFINKLAYKFRDPARGDVIGVRYAGEHIMLLKRIVGLPGDRVAIVDGIIYINGEPLKEPYVIFKRHPWQRPEVTLKATEYFVVGDNRSMDQDAHYFGRVWMDQIVGKVLL